MIFGKGLFGLGFPHTAAIAVTRPSHPSPLPPQMMVKPKINEMSSNKFEVKTGFKYMGGLD
jgi:hypothetical protein